MPRVTTDDIHYKLIADKLRHYEGYGQTFTPAQMPDAVAKACSRMYANGKIDGYGQGSEAERVQCAQKHFTGKFRGKDERGFSIAIPFNPTLILVESCYPYVNSQNGSFVSMAINMRSWDRFLGRIQYNSNSGTMSTIRVPTSVRDAYFQYKDGIFTFQPPDNVMIGTYWRSQAVYNVIAVALEPENIAALIAEQIVDLPDAVPAGNTGTLNFDKSMVESTFTTSEWEQLVARKPNWNITAM